MKRILIIEDNLEIAELERDFLEASAIESVIETDGTKGLERALQENFDLILMNAGPTERALRKNGILRPAAFEVEHLATALAMVRNGMGISILPSSVLPTLNMDGLVCLPIDGPMAIRDVGIIVRNGLPLSAPALAFTDLIESSTQPPDD